MTSTATAKGQTRQPEVARYQMYVHGKCINLDEKPIGRY
jgi:hypothetical protein